MASITEILQAGQEDLVKLVYDSTRRPTSGRAGRLRGCAKRLGLNDTQLICGLGFNPSIRDLTDVLAALGFEDYDALARRRNALFIHDIYQRLSIDDILAIYAAVCGQTELMAVMQYLVAARLERIESRIDQTVNPFVIERYKAEMRAIYNEGIAQLEFAEARLNRTDSGFRALVNEVGIIVESRLIPVGDIFFRETVLPEEKRRIIHRGLIPKELIQSRLQDPGISAQERSMLEDALEHLG